MAGTPETPLPVEETYRDLLRAAVDGVGGQHRAAALAGLTQPTVSRTLTREARATYTALRKLADVLPGVPDPVVPVRDQDHERWCKIGAALAELKPGDFRVLLAAATRLLSDGVPTPTDAQIDAVKITIASPEPRRGTRRRARR